MRQFKFMLKRIFGLDYKKMWKTAKKISEETNKKTLSIFLNMLGVGIKYQAGYIDYYSMGFYDLTKEQRKTYLTRGSNNNMVAHYNPKEYRFIFDDKRIFNELFEKYLKRDWLYLNNNFDEFETFIKNKKEIIAKLIDESGGKGVEKINVKDYKTTKDLYKYLINSKHLLVEEVVLQHEKLDKLHPMSVNTVRIITVFSKGKVNIITAFLRIGNGNIVDNSSSGGMLAPIDIKTGIINFPAADGNLNVYEKHPITDVKIKGFKVPYWDETLKLVEELAKVEKRIRYVGWDIAITKDGPLVIEGNPYPSYTFYQLLIHTPEKEGLLVKFKDLD